MSAPLDAPALRFPEFSEEWVHASLGEFCDCLSGYPIPGDEILEVPKGVRLLRGANITEGRIRHSTELDRYYSGDLRDLGRFILSEGDVVIGMDGSKVGKNVAIISGKDVGSFLIQRVARLRALKNHSLHFVYHQIIGEQFRAYVDVVNSSSGIPHISLKQIRDFPIRKPSFSEQQKIADFLGAVDARVGLLRQRRDALRAYKKGMMQRLFTQELRFTKPDGSSFPNWQAKRLGEVVTIGSGRDYKHLNQGEIPVYGTGGYMTSVDNYLYDGDSVCIGRKGTIDAPVFLTGKFWTVDTLFYTHKFKGVLPRFLFAIFQRINWLKHNEASGVPSLSKATIESIQITLPHPEEQQKIADILTALDAKIDAVTAQLDAMLRFKKGLLQQMFV